MITLSFFLTFLGFYMFYNTSQRAKLIRTNGLEIWVQDHHQPAKYAGGFLFLVALILCILQFGVGSGIFSFFVMLMTVGSLIILLSPLQYINYRTVSGVFLLSILLEII
uniref:DUF3325 domain-containing protein n=1 Tax=Roseihalotalea indica TaxID=2867963 RepID=A0AA49JBP8_9BACT|nr:hypothetical protein K4G66_20985 [Tunicatimonas sp. TK19036]